jgi:Zn-dependent protease
LGVKIGALLGIDIRVDFSWFIIFFLILWSFTSAVYPESVPGLSPLVYLAMGISGTLAFFASLVAHELSHSVVARRRGIPVEGITLFIFGGMAITRAEAQKPIDELVIAGVGPLASLTIGAGLGLLQFVGASAGWPLAVLSVLYNTMMLNFMLAAFNLLPGMPLDGGRILRALVWKATGSAGRAARVATGAGRGLAFLLVALGLFQAFNGNVIGGLWLVFIGWFLHNAALNSYRQYVVTAMLAGVRARDAMTASPECVDQETSIRAAVHDYFMRRGYTAYPVLSRGRPVGVITLTQAREVPQEQWATQTVKNVMTPLTNDVVVRPEEAMTVVLDRMRRSPAGRVLVVRGEKLEGIITANDVAAWVERERRTGPP